MKKKIGTVLLIIIILLYANIGLAANDEKDPILFLYSIVGTSETYIDLDAQPGEEVSFSIELYNSGTTKKTNNLFISDGITANNGGTMVLTPQEALRDKVGSWFNFSAEEVTLNAGEKRVFDFVANVPDNTPPGTHVAVIYLRSAIIEGESSDVSSGGSSFKINEAYSFSSAVIIRTPGEIKYDFTIGEIMEKRWIKDKYLTLFFNIKNVGNIYDYPKASISMHDSLGEVIYLSDKDLGVIYPDNDCVIDFLIPPEHYSADIFKIILTLTFAKNKSMQVQREFEFDIAPIEVIAANTKIEDDLNRNNAKSADSDKQNDITSVSSKPKKNSSLINSIVSFGATLFVVVLIILLIRLLRNKIKNK